MASRRNARTLARNRRGVVTLNSPWPGWKRIAEDACRRFQWGSSFEAVGRWLAAVTKGRR